MKQGDLVEVMIDGDRSTWRVIRLEPEFASRADQIQIVDRRGKYEDRPGKNKALAMRGHRQS